MRPGRRSSVSRCITRAPTRSSTRWCATSQSIVREAEHVFREYPPFEGNTYTFIADYLPWANGDGMEHRNSTIITSPSSIRTSRLDLLEHDLARVLSLVECRAHPPAVARAVQSGRCELSGELWLAEGFTNYYGALILKRTGLTTVRAFAQDMGAAIDTVVNSPGRSIRSAVEMSQMAPFVDRASFTDRTNFANTFISYYTWGSVIGLGLDLTLRDRSDGRVTLDDFMRALWEKYGRPGTRTPGLRRDAVHDRQPEIGARRRGGRRRVCQRLLRALYPGPRGGGLHAAARRGGPHPAPRRPGVPGRERCRRRTARTACA